MIGEQDNTARPSAPAASADATVADVSVEQIDRGASKLIEGVLQ
ncbi:hypothetical protein [Frankia sp. KB5]|nr:hypothetical protein [Frankia sp. KB5]